MPEKPGYLSDKSPIVAAHEASKEGKINIIEMGGEEVAILPASSPWVNGLRTAISEERSESTDV